MAVFEIEDAPVDEVFLNCWHYSESEVSAVGAAEVAELSEGRGVGGWNLKCGWGAVRVGQKEYDDQKGCEGDDGEGCFCYEGCFIFDCGHWFVWSKVGTWRVAG